MPRNLSSAGSESVLVPAHIRPGPVIRRWSETLHEVRRHWFAYLLLAPALALIALLMLYPAGWAVNFAFRQVTFYNLSGPQPFVGLENFVRIFRDEVFLRKVVPNTAYFVGGSVILQLGFGLALALLLNQRWVRGARFYRALFLLPWVTSSVVIGYSWVFVYDSRLGLLNQAMLALGLEPVGWLSDTRVLLPALIVANVWKGTAFSLLMMSAGLQSIDETLYEAAAIDGATGPSALRYLTLPLLKPFVLINLIMITLATFNVFDLIYVMTNGGPLFNSEVMSLYMYHQAFEHNYFGVGAAAAMLLLLVNLALTLLYLRFLEEQP